MASHESVARQKNIFFWILLSLASFLYFSTFSCLAFGQYVLILFFGEWF